MINKRAVMGNKYSDGTPARQGDVVLTDEGARVSRVVDALFGWMAQTN